MSLPNISGVAEWIEEIVVVAYDRRNDRDRLVQKCNALGPNSGDSECDVLPPGNWQYPVGVHCEPGHSCTRGRPYVVPNAARTSPKICRALGNATGAGGGALAGARLGSRGGIAGAIIGAFWGSILADGCEK